jgi:hypothetical protein
MAGGDQPARQRGWNALAIGLTVLYLAGLVLFCYSALTTTPTPSRYAITQWPFRAYSDPRSWWPVALQLALGVGAFGAYYIPRRNETRSFSLLITGGLGVSTIVLGVCSVWNCTEQESPFFTPLAIALGLLLGSTPTFVGACATGQPYPLALQLARLLGPLLLVITALGIVAALFRAQLDRLVVRLARSLVVVVGLSEDAIPVLRRLAHDLPRRTVLAVLVSDADHPLTNLTRAIGARVVVCDLEDTSAIRVLVLRQNRFKVKALYVISEDVSANLAWARQFHDIADASGLPDTEPPPRITARIDDPWQAEYWRRTNAYRTPAGGGKSVRWVSDALSIYEVTAAVLVAHVQSEPHDRLAVVGSSPLALAICAELAQRQREGAVLGSRPAPSFGELVLVGPTAADLRDQHQIRQERFGNSSETGAIAIELAEPTEPGLAQLLADYEAPAVIFADDLIGARKDDLSATLLAALHPNWTIYHSDATTQGLVHRPIMERLYPFGLTIEPPEGAAVDSWERAARVVHQTYLASLGDQVDPSKPAQRPWEELSPFYRASNVRLITATLAAAESVGRTWGPTSTGPGDSASTAVDPGQLRVMAECEHESWRRFYLEHGWSYRATRNDAKQVHNALVPWSDLEPSYRERAIGNVKAALGTLHALGYRSSMASDRPWQTVSRRGEVKAKVLESDWRWQTATGAWLQARAGDYQVSNGTGEAWSVEPEIFAKSYEHIEGDWWRRTGQVSAQPALPGELVISLEGPATAAAGDWVIKGAAGEQWITSAEQFAAN